MGRTGWIAGLTLMAAVVASDTSAAESFEPLDVLVIDDVGVPGDILERGRHEASRIFEKLGIGLIWVEGGMPKARRYLIIIRIVSKSPGRESRYRGVLGTAAASTGNRAMVAWLFYDRIDEERKRLDVDLALMLGHVIAHEMGHLLLPYGSHSVAGLMKENWDTSQAAQASRRSLTFSSEEAEAIRVRLRDFSRSPNP